MIRQEEVYRIGRIGKPHGVKGEVSFQFSDDVFDRVDADYLVLEVDGILVPFFIEEYRFRSDESALLKLEGIDSQEDARGLTNCAVYFERRLSDGDEEPTMAAIVGFLLVDDTDGKVIGTIVGIDDATANMLFEVQTGDGKEAPLLIPVAEEFIRNIDNENREIRVVLPEGLLDL